MNLPTIQTNTLLLALLLIIFTGCSQKTTVVLLPDPDGEVGHITVTTDVGSIDISQAGDASTISSKDSLPSPPKQLTKDELDAEFSGVLATLPSQPVHIILYFKQGTTELTAESTKKLPAILTSIKQRSSQDIGVIGHSDTAGNSEYNLQLSTQRALAISHLLVKYGVNKNHIKTTSHGEENPLVKTADNVHEARNRRVEVVIR